MLTRFSFEITDSRKRTRLPDKKSAIKSEPKEEMEEEDDQPVTKRARRNPVKLEDDEDEEMADATVKNETAPAAAKSKPATRK
jgi:hypothetical protein